MKPLAPGRVRCCVPFCGRTFKVEHEGAEVMCGKHWRMAPLSMRRWHRKMTRVWRLAVHVQDEARYARAATIANRLWERIKARSIGVAMGYGT